MDTLTCLKSRRSCKNFTGEKIPSAILSQILEAGEYAPSGRGMQSAIMVVVQEEKMVKYLSSLNARILGNEKADPFYHASTVIIVLANSDNSTYVEDGSLVMGNLLNAANDLGIGACWIHRAREVFSLPEGKALLKEWGIEGNYVGIAHCVLGYKNSEPSPAKPRKKDYIRYV